MPFSEKAKALYLKGNLSQKDIAKLANVSESAVSRYFSGKTVPQEDVAEKILQVLAAAIPVEPPKAEPAPQKEQPQDLKMAIEHVSRIYESHIAELKEELRIQRREKWTFVCALGLVITLVFLIFFIDLTNGNVGWWRY